MEIIWKIMCRSVIFLLSICATCNAFWWGSSRAVEPPQPAIKQVPIGYFRAFTYQPLTLNPQAPNHYFTYQMSPKPISPFINWPQKSFAPISSIQAQGYASAVNPPQFFAEPSVAAPLPPPSQPHVNLPVNPTSTNPAYQQGPANLEANYISPNSLPPPNNNNVINIEQITSPSPSSINNEPPESVRQFQQSEQMNSQYFTNIPAMPQIQFVPCMCPVSLSMSPEIIANKRSDDTVIQSEMRNMINEYSEQDKLTTQQSGKMQSDF